MESFADRAFVVIVSTLGFSFLGLWWTAHHWRSARRFFSAFRPWGSRKHNLARATFILSFIAMVLSFVLAVRGSVIGRLTWLVAWCAFLASAVAVGYFGPPKAQRKSYAKQRPRKTLRG